MIDAATRIFVRRRANEHCEYCGLAQVLSPLSPLQIEHVRPRKHNGTDDPDNLAIACIDCNLHKGSDVAGFDPQTDTLTPLFNPRLEGWDTHFERRGLLIVGLTAVGRTTAALLQFNSEDRLQLRAAAGFT